MKSSKSRKVFVVCNTIFMLFMCFITLYPFYYSVIASFSDPVSLLTHEGMLWAPIKPFTLEAYEAVLAHPLITTGFRNSFFVLVVGTCCNIVFTILGAYFLSLEGPMLKNVFAVMVVFSMYFSGGMIPGYLNVKDLGLIDSIWALIIPTLIGTQNMIIMRTAFQSVPGSLKEAAILDGASHLQLLTKVMVPLSKATIAVLVLYYGVGHWNAWFNASIYIRDNTKFPVQLVARNFLVKTENIGGGAETQLYEELFKYALIIIVSTPIILLYPFLQKYFAKGVMVGALKG